MLKVFTEASWHVLPYLLVNKDVVDCRTISERDSCIEHASLAALWTLRQRNAPKTAQPHTWDQNKTEEKRWASAADVLAANSDPTSERSRRTIRIHSFIYAVFTWRLVGPSHRACRAAGRQASPRCRPMIDAILPDPRRPRGDHRLVQSRITVAGKLISARNHGAGRFCDLVQEETTLYAVIRRWSMTLHTMSSLPHAYTVNSVYV